MAWFKKQDSRGIELQRTMGRIINGTFSIENAYPELRDAAEEGRTENRSERVLPIAIFSGKADSENPRLIVGFTHNISMKGMAILTTCDLETGEVVLVLGDADDRVFLEAECLYSKVKEFGCFESGFRINNLLDQQAQTLFIECIDSVENKVPARN